MRMRLILLSLIALLVAGYTLLHPEQMLSRVLATADKPHNQTTPSTPKTDFVADLPDYGTAPELSNEAWLNTDKPLRLADLRGQVVLLEMWTFDCINCIRTLPYMRQWHETYADQGLMVIGNHYPEFGYEHDIANVRAAMERLEITYAVAQDNDRATWSAYNNRYWPTIYLIDKRGQIRYRHIGEGAYDATEQAIRDLLRETYTPPTEVVADPLPLSLTSNIVLNVRTGPGIDFERVGAIHPGEVFVVRGEQDGWYRIRYNDDERYVFGEFVDLIE